MLGIPARGGIREQPIVRTAPEPARTSLFACHEEAAVGRRDRRGAPVLHALSQCRNPDALQVTIDRVVPLSVTSDE